MIINYYRSVTIIIFVCPNVAILYCRSTIEQWMQNSTIATCSNVTLDPSNQEWWDARVLPYSQMTLKGWVWYQGENNMYAPFGNSEQRSGYSCLMQALVKEWRELWSKTEGTTPKDAWFGLVTLASSGNEGGNDIGSMRIAQTGSYGILPNDAMPHTFLAQAFDLDDPFTNDTCYYKKCWSEERRGQWVVVKNV